MLKIGDILDHKYRILSEIGRGGMSIVYLAINERANKTWAVKEIRKDKRPDLAAESQRLLMETEMMKRLRHPGLPGIVDIIDTKDAFLIVMDYIEGISLSRLLKTEGRQEEERVIRWGKQLCDVLEYLHGQDPPVIYRDMKPSNIMLRPDDTVVLIDLGTAREFKQGGRIEDTACLGTRGYAAPEQYGGRGQTDQRTDIYCLGATLYHLLTGRSPAEPPFEIKPLGFWFPGRKGSGLEKLIQKCTEQDPQKRYQNCGELKAALEHYREEDDVCIKRDRKRITAFAATLLIAVLSFAGMLFFRSGKDRLVNASYENLLSAAMYQEDLKDAESFFLQALEVDAGRGEAYRDLMKKAGDEIAKEDKLLPRTAKILGECLTKRTDGIRTNLDVLKEKDPETYAHVLYEIGLWYFFLKDNTDEDRKTAAANYLSRLTNEEQYLAYLPYGQQEMAKIMAKIGGYIADLGTKMGQISEQGSSYAVLFKDLRAVVSDDLKAKVGLDYYCIAICRQAACWIDRKGSDFLSAGITKEEMERFLKETKTVLESLKIAPQNDLYKEYEEAAAAVDAAGRSAQRLDKDSLKQ